MQAEGNKGGKSDLKSQAPWILVLEDFLSPSESDLMVSVAEEIGLAPEPDLPADVRDVSLIDCNGPNCITNPFIMEIYSRVSRLLQVPPENFESLEFLRPA